MQEQDPGRKLSRAEVQQRIAEARVSGKPEEQIAEAVAEAVPQDIVCSGGVELKKLGAYNGE